IGPSIAKGYPYGVIIGSRNVRNAHGQLLVNSSPGAYVPAEAGKVIADPNPEWLAGLHNRYKYKGVSLSVLFDTRQGGDIDSFSMTDLKTTGSLAITGENRELPRILPGVIDNGDGTYRPNNIQISPQTYWSATGSLASEGAVFDA